MLKFPTHDLSTVPGRSRPILEQTQKSLGFVPNLYVNGLALVLGGVVAGEREPGHGAESAPHTKEVSSKDLCLEIEGGRPTENVEPAKSDKDQNKKS